MTSSAEAAACVEPSASVRRLHGRRVRSAPVAEPVAEEVLQVGDGVDLLDRRLDVVLDAAVADGVAVEQDVAGPPVAVARLADRADVAQRLAAVELVGVVDLLGAVELVQVVGSCSVKMPGTCVWPWKQ